MKKTDSPWKTALDKRFELFVILQRCKESTWCQGRSLCQHDFRFDLREAPYFGQRSSEFVDHVQQIQQHVVADDQFSLKKNMYEHSRTGQLLKRKSPGPTLFG